MLDSFRQFSWLIYAWQKSNLSRAQFLGSTTFEGILDLAKANSVQVFLYYSPIYKSCRVHEEEKIKGYYRELAAKNSISLIFIDDESILGQAENFKDITHMNSRGAHRFTKTIAERIRSTDAIATE